MFFFLIVMLCSLFLAHFSVFPLFFTAGTYWWLFLWSGHQPTPWWFSAGDRSHSLHRDSGPHDFCHLLCLQWLLCSLCWHQEWASKEGKSQLRSSSKAITGHFCSLHHCDTYGVQAVGWSVGHRHCEVLLFPCRWIMVTAKLIFLIFNACCQRVRER